MSSAQPKPHRLTAHMLSAARSLYVQLLPPSLPEVMQCNAMQGERNARPKGRLLIREWNPALTAFATGMAASRTFLVSSELSVLLLLDVTSGTGKRMQDPACPFCPSCQPAFPTTPGSLGKCMQVLGAQSNLPTLLCQSGWLAPCPPGRIAYQVQVHYTAGK